VISGLEKVIDVELQIGIERQLRPLATVVDQDNNALAPWLVSARFTEIQGTQLPVYLYFINAYLPFCLWMTASMIPDIIARLQLDNTFLTYRLFLLCRLPTYDSGSRSVCTYFVHLCRYLGP
jgi:hypothetical protein